MGKLGHVVRAAFVAVLLLAPGAAFAQANWDGSDSIDWDDLNNWFGGTTPTNGPDINIDTVEANPPFSPVIDSSTTNTSLSSSFLYVGKSNGSDAGLIISDGGVLQPTAAMRVTMPAAPAQSWLPEPVRNGRCPTISMSVAPGMVN